MGCSSVLPRGESDRAELRGLRGKARSWPHPVVLEAAFAREEISFSQWAALVCLRDGIARTAADLSRCLSHDSGSLTRLIDQLEGRNLVQRRSHPGDRRAYELVLTQDASFLAFVIPVLVQGIAMGTFFIAMIGILLEGVAPQRIPAASGLSNFARITAGGFAAAVTTTLWDRREALHQSRLVEKTSSFDPAMHQTMTTLHHLGLSDPQSYALILRNITGQAYLLSSIDFFWISAWISLAMLVPVWLARAPRGAVRHVASE
jgi:DNA-binding MarR family transcriptional regulator